MSARASVRAFEDAIRQYKIGRDPREPVLAHGRCLAHFAVDTELVYVTARLAAGRRRASCPSTRAASAAPADSKRTIRAGEWSAPHLVARYRPGAADFAGEFHPEQSLLSFAATPDYPTNLDNMVNVSPGHPSNQEDAPGCR